MHCSTTSRSCRMLYVNKQKMPLALCTEKNLEKKSFYPSFFFFPPENWRHWIWECWSTFVPWSVLFYCRRCKKIQSRWLRKRSCHYSTWTLCSHHCACCLWFYRYVFMSFQYLSEIEFRDTSKNFKSFSSFRQLLFSSFFYRLSDFCEVSRNSFSNRCWKFQLSILKNKKGLFLKNII